MAKVVCTAQLFHEDVERLAAAGHTVVGFERDSTMSQTQLAETLTDADALICQLTDRIDHGVIDASRALRVIANVAVGYENIDLAAARERGVVVSNTPDVLTEATADLTFALLLGTARRLPEADAAVRHGEFPTWGLEQDLTGVDVHGKTLGILGMGRIGTAVARRGRFGFAMRVVYHNRTRNETAERDLDAEFVSLDRLLAESDFVCLHVPLTEETRHLIGAAELSRMKTSAILVNVARGPVVDEAALVNALEAGAIAGAGLDVYEREPEVHPGLLDLHERVVLAPHLGSATRETRRSMARLAVDNVLAVLSGEPPLTPVD